MNILEGFHIISQCDMLIHSLFYSPKRAYFEHINEHYLLCTTQRFFGNKHNEAFHLRCKQTSTILYSPKLSLQGRSEQMIRLIFAVRISSLLCSSSRVGTSLRISEILEHIPIGCIKHLLPPSLPNIWHFEEIQWLPANIMRASPTVHLQESISDNDILKKH